MKSIKLKSKSPLSFSDQLADQIRSQILSGVLKPNARLQSVRGIAKDHSINPMTAHAAIRLLKSQGLLTTARSKGTFVSANAPELARHYCQTMARSHLLGTFRDVASLGLSLAELKSMIGIVLGELKKEF